MAGKRLAQMVVVDQDSVNNAGPVEFISLFAEDGTGYSTGAGAKGDTGATGATGPQGPAGPAGVISGFWAPDVFALTDGSSINIDASLGNECTVTIAGNRTMNAPTNPHDGQPLTIDVTQDGTGSRTLTWASGTDGYSFGGSTAPILSTTPGAMDSIVFKYSLLKRRWVFRGYLGGF